MTVICRWIFFIGIIPFQTYAQFSHEDTLRGSNGEGRNWWDIQRYDISITPDFKRFSISGKVNIVFTPTITANKIMQLDLQRPMKIDSILFEGQNVSFKRENDIYWINLTGTRLQNKQSSMVVYYHGIPKRSQQPPWDGGVTWTKDKNNLPWMSIACQGAGASVWFPCKDYQGDEPDKGASITIKVLDKIVAVSNGRLTSQQKNNDRTQNFTWEVLNPINNYNIIPYAGRYVNFNETYNGENGPLQMNYWVLNYNLEKARKQFQQAKLAMKAFEFWFGPYPFYNDTYKLVESPFVGMEHQSAVAYGNNFRNGYRGLDNSGTGWGLKWDYIIVHESAHEWFGNNITSIDIADMWIHESFANYAEVLFTEFYYGKKAADEYNAGLRRLIRNETPIIGVYGVNNEGSTDMYYKGCNMVHTIRQIINNDSLFRKILRGLNNVFYHKTVTTKEIEQYISKESGIDLSFIFDQYLRTTMVPVLQYSVREGNIMYRWNNCVKGFNMPVKVMMNGKYSFIYPLENWQQVRLDGDLKVDDNFYISKSRL